MECILYHCRYEPYTSTTQPPIAPTGISAEAAVTIAMLTVIVIASAISWYKYRGDTNSVCPDGKHVIKSVFDSHD